MTVPRLLQHDAVAVVLNVREASSRQEAGGEEQEGDGKEEESRHLHQSLARLLKEGGGGQVEVIAGEKFCQFLCSIDEAEQRENPEGDGSIFPAAMEGSRENQQVGNGEKRKGMFVSFSGLRMSTELPAPGDCLARSSHSTSKVSYPKYKKGRSRRL